MTSDDMPEPKESIITSHRIDRVILGLVIVCFLAFALHNVIAYDIWWQLKTGQYIREFGWPATDPFSYGFPNREWIEMRWLYNVAISFIFDKLGLNFLILAKVIWLGLAGLCIWMIGRKGVLWATNLALLCAVVLMHQRTTIRPELVTYLFLALEFLLLYRFQSDEDRRWLYPLPLLQVLWVNSHTLYALGPIFLWAFTAAEAAAVYLPVDAIRERAKPMSAGAIKMLALASAAMAAACLVNPYGLRGALFAGELFAEIQAGHAINALITELRTPFATAGPTLLFIAYVLVALISAAGFWLNRRSLRFGWLAIWAASLYLSVLSERNLALFGIVAAVTMMLNFGRAELGSTAKWASRAISAGFCLVMVPLIVSNYYYRSTEPNRHFGFGVAERKFPIRALAFADAEQLPRPVMTNLGDASLALYMGGEKSVYIDGRLEVYGGPNVVEGLDTLSSAEKITNAADRLGVPTLIINHEVDPGLAVPLSKDYRWAAVYFDDSHVVFVRTTLANTDITARLRIDWNEPRESKVSVPAQFAPSNWLSFVPAVADNSAERSLGQFLLAAGNVPTGQAHLEEAVRIWPDPRSCLTLAILYRAQGREPEAERQFAQVPQAMINTLETQKSAALTYESFKNSAAAATAWQEVVKLGDSSPEVQQHLAKAAVESENWNAAYAAFAALSKTAPSDVEVLNNLGYTAFKLNKKSEALSALERSIQIKPAQPEILTQIGVMKLESRNIDAARGAFESALRYDPNFAPAKQYLEMLRSAQP